MKKISTLILLLITLFTLNIQLVLAESNADKEPWSKYPDNSTKTFPDADSFYDSLDKNWYVEYKNAKLNIREKTYFKDINKVLAKADKYGESRTGGEGYHPKRQVYVFVTVSEDGEKMRTAVFDAETKRFISGSSNYE
ncbi:hypothetical protein [Fredinandcohnia sp. 179-A 10B2 NHS]|uniref:hypothetical protein n=1 Tax=Fredinandcohnia sp. 179-A 10B2 NHS TaxID=3235176 RepID=UPI0039A0666D